MELPAPHPLRVGSGDHGYELDALLAYDQFVDATRGMALAYRLSEQLGAQYQVSIDLVKFSLLAHSSARQSASELADRANLIFLAASGRTDLPPHVAIWVNGWSPRKHDNPCALIAVLDQEAVGGAATVNAYLSGIAAHSGMQFYCNLGTSIPAHMIPGAQISSSRDTTIRDWGLNEY